MMMQRGHAACRWNGVEAIVTGTGDKQHVPNAQNSYELALRGMTN
jgi:hypothetical protein